MSIESHGPTIPHRRGCFFHLRRVLKWLGIILVGFVTLGIVLQMISSSRDRVIHTPPGQMIEVDGHMMHIHCTGEGRPTVILENGAFGFSAEWYWVQQKIAETNRVCSYDRAGMGWSESGPGPRTSQQIASELHTLLHNAHIAGPYVLVGHSFGGIHNRVYASQYPGDVIGIVLVDTAVNTLHFKADAEYLDYKRSNDLLNFPVWLLVRTGIARLTFPGTYRDYGYPSDVADLIAAFRSNNQTFDTYYAEGIAVAAQDSEESDAARNLGHTPLMILWAGVLPRKLSADEDALLTQYRQEITTFSTNSAARVIDGADHGSIIGTEKYAQQVSQAVQDVIAAQSGDPLTP